MLKRKKILILLKSNYVIDDAIQKCKEMKILGRIIPPKIYINSPADGAVVTSSPVTVTGLINDIVRGTVNEAEGAVAVNGVEARVQNRGFIAEGIVLSEGKIGEK